MNHVVPEPKSTLLVTLVALSLLIGCNSFIISCDSTQPLPQQDDDGWFESANPGSTDDSRNEPPTAGAGGSASGDGDASPDRIIEEADVVKLEGDALYALSRYGGLSVIDVSDSDHLQLLGRHKLVATPFEMYVREGIVFALYQGYGEYVYDEDLEQAQWVQTSQVVAVDARNPAQLTVLAQFEIPGVISDSRIVGDVLYVASFEDGYCWGCRENAPRTAVISLDLSEPSEVRKVSELSFDERTDAWSWHRSIAVTDQRMYVSGPTWSDAGPIGSTIQVVDISSPDGTLREGASIQVAGQINSRWQMDEYNGVLRVISQPFSWALSTSPTLQTFTVASANDVTPLGQTELTLPRPEQLQSARFDGDRGYAITFERTDPLITLDLSDPAAPKQAGLLEMPGWVYYMEPRGDRVLGLGFDQSTGTGALTVTLFDVSDLTAPAQLDRVNFGGEWAWLAEDQDRIHKAFNVLDADGLILVPFSGYNTTVAGAYECGGVWQSGVQLIDWDSDTLQLRGMAPARSDVRRGFLHDERLFTMSDERVETFDIADRDAPAAKSAVSLAQNMSFITGVGDDRVVRVGQNWWTGATQLDLTTLDRVAVPVASGTLELDGNDATSCYGGDYLDSILVDAGRVNLVYLSYGWDPATGKEQQSARIATVDVSEAEPTLLAENELQFGLGSYYYSYGLVDRGARQVVVGTTLAIAETSVTYGPNEPIIDRSVLHVIDLSDPTSLQQRTVALPAGLGTTGLIASGNLIARSHYAASPTNHGSVRFYLDRVDVSEPKDPVVLPQINIPGSLLAFDAENGRAVTVDYGAEVIDGITAAECYANPNARFDAGTTGYDWNITPGRCTLLNYSLNLSELDSDRARVIGRYEIDSGEQLGQIALGEDRLFVTLSTGYGWVYGYADGVGTPGGVAVSDCYGFCGFDPEQNHLPVLSLSGLSSGDFSVGRVDIPGGDSWSYAPIAAAGSRAVLSSGWRGKLTVLDASDNQAPTVVREEEIAGYVQSLSLVGNTAIAAMGMDGVQTIDLSN